MIQRMTSEGILKHVFKDDSDAAIFNEKQLKISI